MIPLSPNAMISTGQLYFGNASANVWLADTLRPPLAPISMRS